MLERHHDRTQARKPMLLLAFVILSFGIRHSANAAVIYSGLQNIAIPTTFDGIYLDIDTGTTSTSTITGWDVNFFFGGIGIGGSAAFPARPHRHRKHGHHPPLRHRRPHRRHPVLHRGETGSSDHLGAPGNFQDGVEGYLGFRFTKNEAALSTATCASPSPPTPPAR